MQISPRDMMERIRWFHHHKSQGGDRDIDRSEEKSIKIQPSLFRKWLLLFQGAGWIHLILVEQ